MKQMISTYLTAIKGKAGNWWDIVLVIGNSVLVKDTFMIHIHILYEMQWEKLSNCMDIPRSVLFFD